MAVSVFPQDFLPWAPNQPDNWQDNEDCVQLRGMNHHEPGKLNDDFCTSTKEFICKKGLDGDVFTRAVYVAFLPMRLLFTAKGQGPPPQPPTFGPGEADSPPAPTRHLIGPVYPTINSVRLS